jgi:hypothetical protein
VTVDREAGAVQRRPCCILTGDGHLTFGHRGDLTKPLHGPPAAEVRSDKITAIADESLIKKSAGSVILAAPGKYAQKPRTLGDERSENVAPMNGDSLDFTASRSLGYL